MPRQLRIRDETGGSAYYDATGVAWYTLPVVASTDESNASDYVAGAGVFDIMKNVVRKAVTSKAAKKMATKAAEKLVEKSAEKTGQKIGDLLGEKIYDSFNSKSSNREDLISPVVENRGDLIIKELQKLKKPEHKAQSSEPKAQSFAVAELLKSPSKKSISEQFDELLKL